MMNGREQGEWEDVIMRHRWLYYIELSPLLTDSQYDALERRVVSTYPVGIAACCVGWNRVGNYPLYIVEGRRPDADERAARDKRIAEIYMEKLI